MENHSLMKILQNDEVFGEILKKKTEAIKKNKQTLVSAAKEYTQKYKEEIEEGTKLRQKLLTEGENQSKTEDEILSNYGRFIPSIHTPILNWLFFTFRDEEFTITQTKKNIKKEEIIKEFINQCGYELTDLIDLYIKGIADSLPEGYDDKDVSFEDVIREENTNEPDEMDTFIYGNLTHAEFKRLKKLKALSQQSSNEKESFLAYRKCIELCKRYGLNFNKIPCNTTKYY